MRSSLAARAAWLVVAVFATAFAVVGGLALRAFESQYETQAAQHQTTMVRAVAETLDQKFAVTRDVLHGAARLIAPVQWRDAGDATRFLNSRTYLLKQLELGLAMHRIDGTLWARSDGASPRWDEEAVAQAVRATTQGGGPQALPLVDARLGTLILLTVPVLDPDGVPLGVLSGLLRLNSPEYAGGLVEVPVGKTGYLYLFDAQRTLLMHPDPARVMKLAAQPGQNLGLDRALNEGFEGTVDNVNSRGLHALATFVRLPHMGWILAANYPMDELRQPLRRSMGLGVAGLLVAVLTATVLMVWALRRLLRPIQDLAERMRSVGLGEAQPYTGQAHGEVADMGAAYNHMLADLARSEGERQTQAQRVLDLNAALETRVAERTAELALTNRRLAESLDAITRMQDERIRTEKVLALSRVVAGLAHELGTPTGNALTLTSTLADRQRALGAAAQGGALRRQELQAFLGFADQSTAVIERNLERIGGLVQRMRELSESQETLRITEFELRTLIASWAASHQGRAAALGVELQVHGEGPCWLQAPAPTLLRVLDHLLDNALGHAFPEPRTQPARVSLELRRDTERPACWLIVSDNGVGIPAEQQAGIFDPFAKASMAQEGLGLGLSLVHHLVTSVLNGSISVGDVEGGGTLWRIHLPDARWSEASEPSGSAGAEPR